VDGAVVLILLLPINLTRASKSADSNWASLSVVITVGVPYLTLYLETYVLKKAVIIVSVNYQGSVLLLVMLLAIRLFYLSL